MKFTVLPARVDVGQCCRDEAREFRTGKALRDLLRIEAGDAGRKPSGEHILRQAFGWDTPDRKQRGDAGAGEARFAIAADVGEVQVAEGHVRHPVRHGLADEFAHDALIVGIAAWIGDRDLGQRQPRACRLGLHELPPDGMHRHAIERAVDGGEQAGNLDPLATRQVQRPGRILARAPTQKCFHSPGIPRFLARAPRKGL